MEAARAAVGPHRRREVLGQDAFGGGQHPLLGRRRQVVRDRLVVGVHAPQVAQLELPGGTERGQLRIAGGRQVVDGQLEVVRHLVRGRLPLARLVVDDADPRPVVGPVDAVDGPVTE